jgi:hypothetical protein
VSKAEKAGLILIGASCAAIIGFLLAVAVTIADSVGGRPR